MLREFNFVLEQRFSRSSQIENYFSKDKVKSILCFNSRSFDELWTKNINILISCYKNRVLEFNHDDKSMFIGHISFADNILDECGTVGLQKLTLFETRLNDSLPAISNLTSLCLYRVDIDIQSIPIPKIFPMLKSFLFQPIDSTTQFFLHSLPSPMEDVSLCGLRLCVMKQFVCEEFRIWECEWETDLSTALNKLLFVKELNLIADDNSTESTTFSEHFKIA